jgi:hypothetical protein
MCIFFLGLVHGIYVIILQVTLPQIVLPVEWKREKVFVADVSAQVKTCGSFFKSICQQITNKTHPDHCRCWKWFLLLMHMFLNLCKMFTFTQGSSFTEPEQTCNLKA